MTDLLDAKSDDFWGSNFHDYRKGINPEKHTIGCTNCHDPDDKMRLTLTSVPLKEYLERQGKEWQEKSTQKMRSLVCAQCHSEYYFETEEQGTAGKVHFPWDNGKDPLDMYEFKSDGDPERDGFAGQFVDWTHAVSKAPMLKVQHPEYEMYQVSIAGDRFPASA
ncbi:ammonia-forming cytochrome c nitrite reductase subunit c552 [Halorhodospira halochloris]|nr:ammonia-forming cytochrome c nitrite reductase subunit c552 [Halorhodospira halochloris]